jgi:hypothetical protein
MIDEMALMIVEYANCPLHTFPQALSKILEDKSTPENPHLNKLEMPSLQHGGVG